MILEKQQLDLWLFFLKQKKKVLSFNEPVSLKKQVSNIKSVLICMPQNHTHFGTALDCVNKIEDKAFDVTIIVDQEEVKVEDFYQGKILKYPPELNRPFPIKEEKLVHIPEHYDVAIDLSQEPGVMSAYLTGSRGRKMTIGLKSGELDVFYTVLIEPVDEYKKAIETMLGVAGLTIKS
jgi:hypothetical protein